MNLRQSRNARSFSSAQRAYDNMTPEDVYGPDDPEPEEEEINMTEPCDVCEVHPANCRCGDPAFAREQRGEIDRLKAELAEAKIMQHGAGLRADNAERREDVLKAALAEKEREAIGVMRDAATERRWADKNESDGVPYGTF